MGGCKEVQHQELLSQNDPHDRDITLCLRLNETILIFFVDSKIKSQIHFTLLSVPCYANNTE